jgi:hypothetical protein
MKKSPPPKEQAKEKPTEKAPKPTEKGEKTEKTEKPPRNL